MTRTVYPDCMLKLQNGTGPQVLIGCLLVAVVAALAVILVAGL